MPVKVKGYLTYKEFIGEQSITIPKDAALTLSDLLTTLANQLGQEFINLIFNPQFESLGEHVVVIVNGRSYRNLPDGLETSLQDGDEVAIFPPMTGG
jgi:molybdopterin synthase sulfur carrier subunit